MRSSYIENNYGEAFRAIVDAFQPLVCVELGVLDGYSALHIGLALQKKGQGHLDAYDLFEKYQYRHGAKEEVENYLNDYDLSSFVRLYQEDAWNVSKIYTSHSVHFLHVDISNDGDTVKRIMQDWDEKMIHGGIICFEGGSEERDQVEWMQKYEKKSLKAEIENNQIIADKYIFGTYLKFPGLTMLLKKRL